MYRYHPVTNAAKLLSWLAPLTFRDTVDRPGWMIYLLRLLTMVLFTLRQSGRYVCVDGVTVVGRGLYDLAVYGDVGLD
jgi:hypothetical protein